MNILVFDIETIPDLETGRKLNDLDGLDDQEVAQILYSQRRQETDGKSDFLKLHMHRVVAISVVLARSDRISVWSIGEEDSDEKEIIQRFFDGIDKYTPTLVSWNGGGFDLPVLHYRGLLNKVVAPRYWENGQDDQGFRWNNYLSRYHERHTDLMDVLAGYQPRANAPLTEVATMLGFPGKMGMSGEKVFDCYVEGDIAAIRNYCETDVLNTYLVYLRYEMMRGRLSETACESECDRLANMLESEAKPHLLEFLEAWKG